MGNDKDAPLAENRKARFNYHIEETFEAGLALKGTEVKSCRAGKIALTDAYGSFRGSELFLQNAHIGEYSHGNRQNHDPRRLRKLLMHRRELDRIMGQMQAGYTLVPLKVYLKNRHIKVLVGLGKGKKSHDKRDDIKKREAQREIERKFRR